MNAKVKGTMTLEEVLNDLLACGSFPSRDDWIAGIRAHLREREQSAGEAVAWRWRFPEEEKWAVWTRQPKVPGVDDEIIVEPLYTHPAQAVSVPDGWRVSFCTSSARRPDDGWEVYDPSGTGGVIGFSQIQSGIVSRLMDQLASAPPHPLAMEIPMSEIKPEVREPKPPHRLWDSQWVNIVNHAHCYEGYTVEDAVHLAVKLTEAAMAENFRYELQSLTARAEKAEAERDALREKYYELLYAVSQKYPDETRHQTALRYILGAEDSAEEGQAKARIVPEQEGSS